MKKIIFATGNADKMKEIRKILADLDAEVVSMKEAGIQADIVEDGKTFEENAVIKATAISKLTSDGEIVLADDSGHEIDYLNKEPGVYSARYMGENTDYHIKNANLIQRLCIQLLDGLLSMWLFLFNLFSGLFPSFLLSPSGLFCHFHLRCFLFPAVIHFQELPKGCF